MSPSVVCKMTPSGVLPPLDAPAPPMGCCEEVVVGAALADPDPDPASSLFPPNIFFSLSIVKVVCFKSFFECCDGRLGCESDGLTLAMKLLCVLPCFLLSFNTLCKLVSRMDPLVGAAS